MLLVFLFGAYRGCTTKLLLQSNCDDYYPVSQQIRFFLVYSQCGFCKCILIEFTEKGCGDSCSNESLGFTEL